MMENVFFQDGDSHVSTGSGCGSGFVLPECQTECWCESSQPTRSESSGIGFAVVRMSGKRHERRVRADC